MKPKRVLEKLKRRQKGHESLVAGKKRPMGAYTKPGSRNPRKR